jgi:hypothetical protein
MGEELNNILLSEINLFMDNKDDLDVLESILTKLQVIEDEVKKLVGLIRISLTVSDALKYFKILDTYQYFLSIALFKYNYEMSDYLIEFIYEFERSDDLCDYLFKEIKDGKF